MAQNQDLDPDQAELHHVLLKLMRLKPDSALQRFLETTSIDTVIGINTTDINTFKTHQYSPDPNRTSGPHDTTPRIRYTRPEPSQLRQTAGS